MNVVGMSPEHQENVLEIISAILHLGNIQFVEDNNVAEVENPAGTCRQLINFVPRVFS